MIRTLLTYFAQFVSEDAVRRMDVNKRHTTIIDELVKEAQGSLSGYIVSDSLDRVRQAILNMSGRFLFLDFGETESIFDDRNRLVSESRVAITVAERRSSVNSDMLTHTLLLDECAKIIEKIHTHLLKDKASVPWLNMIGDKFTLVPFISDELGAIGYSLLFSFRGYDIKQQRGEYVSSRKQ